jgi:exosortase E/protease (VPEID-CTERM system)
MTRPAAGETDASGSAASRRIAWWAALLLLAEFLWLVGRFRVDTLRDSPEEWAQLMFRVKSLPQIAVALGTALLLFQRPQRAPAPSHAQPRPRTPAQLALLIGAQLACFGLLFRSSQGIFEEHLAGVERPLLALCAWLLFGAATALTGILLFVPARTLARSVAARAPFLLGASLVGLLAWRAGQLVVEQLSGPLRGPTLWLGVKLLGLFESQPFVDVARFQFGTPACTVEIAPACSGFEGMGLMAVFACAYVWFFRARLRFPQLLLLPLAGVLAVWVLNVVRIVVLVLIGTHVSRGIAEGGFHSLAGTFAFCLAALALVAVSRRLAFFTPDPRGASAEEERDATLAYLAPFLLVVAFGMVRGALGADGWALDYWKPLAAACALWFLRRGHALAPGPISAPPLLLGALVGLAWIAIPGAEGRTDAGIALPVRILSLVCIVPLVEELAFRGYLMRRLGSSEFESVEPGQVPLRNLALSSLLFGVLHGHWIAATLAGLAYGHAYRRRGRLFDAVLAHAATNLLLAGWAFWRDDWSLV